MAIERQLRDRAFTKDDILDGVNRELMPVARALRQRMNLVLGVPFIIASPLDVLSLDWTSNRHYVVELTANITSVVFTNPTDAGADYCVRFDQTGAFTVAGWPSTVRFIRRVVPTITQIAGASDTFQFFFDGTDYWAEISQGHS